MARGVCGPSALTPRPGSRWARSSPRIICTRCVTASSRWPTPASAGLSVAGGQLFYAAVELQANIWLAERRATAAR